MKPRDESDAETAQCGQGPWVKAGIDLFELDGRQYLATVNNSSSFIDDFRILSLSLSVCLSVCLCLSVSLSLSLSLTHSLSLSHSHTLSPPSLTLSSLTDEPFSLFLGC